MINTTIRVESNLDLLLEHLKENPLARDLVTAYRDAESTEVSETLKDFLQERVKSARHKIENDED